MEQANYQLTLNDVTNRKPAYLETIFSLGNGHFGVRAGDLLTPSATAGTMVNGFYESTPIQYGESAFGYAKNHQTTVALPDLRVITIKTDDGEELKTQRVQSKILDMRSGSLTETWLAATKSGAHFLLGLQSVLEQPAGEAAALTYTIESLDYSGSLTIAKTAAMPKAAEGSDDPRKVRQVQTLRFEYQAAGQFAQAAVTTGNSHQTVTLALQAERGLMAQIDITPGAPVVYPVVAGVSAINKKLGALPAASEITSAAATYWQQFWTRSATTIVGNDELDRAIHYNLFQLSSSAGQDGKTNIAAKGLSGTGYEGHYFWDTEMYMLPFLIFTNPQIARKLLEYRARILPAARERARILGVSRGALFAWRTINGEEASPYFPAGTAQYHIDGDVAYAVNNYFQVTGDVDFMRQTGLELLVETANFWTEFGHYNAESDKRRFEFFGVTGPDEYTAIVNNNYYTNRLAKFNLECAAEMAGKFPGAAAKLGVSPERIAQWWQIAADIYLPYSEKLRIHAQDDSALSKPIWPFADTPKDHYPLLLHYHPLNIYRYQVNKQADTLLADYLFDDGDIAQLKRDYDYYESITTHDSSLSRSIFSALAAKLGDGNKAYKYFMDTARMDLTDMQGNAADGLHIANMGGSWLSIATGFGGIRMEDGTLHVDNHLPQQIAGLRLRLVVAGRLLEVNYQHDGTTARLIKGTPLTVQIDGATQHLEQPSSPVAHEVA